MAKADIVLVTFPFSDLRSKKLRPAVILIESSRDITVCFITSQVRWHEENDMMLFPNSLNGLKKQSLLRIGKIATLDKALAKGLLGSLSVTEIAEFDSKLKNLFQLN